MIDAKEVLRNLRLPAEDEVEVQRIGAEIVAAVRSDKFDGTPVPVTIPVGDTDEEKTRSFRIACAIQRRFQAQGWAVAFESTRVPGLFGLQDAHRLWLTVDAARALSSSPTPTPVNGNGHGSFSLRHLAEELGEMFGSRTTTPTSLPQKLDLSIILGTFNRFSMLKEAIASSRRAAEGLSIEFIVTDGGSTDGSRQWLAVQPDVVLLGHRRLEGATRAFNAAYREARGEFVGHINDDCVVGDRAFIEGVKYLQAHPQCGQVAFGLLERGRKPIVNEVYPKSQFPSVTWGTTYANFGVIRKSVADIISFIQGGFWNSQQYLTYCGDTETSAWCWKLGMTVDALPHLVVEDIRAEDSLREKNMQLAGAEAKRMRARWPAEAFQQDGPEPNVTSFELERYRKTIRGTRSPSSEDIEIDSVHAAPDDVVMMAELCGFPEPQEERRIREIGKRIRQFDPVEDQFPKRAEKLSAERILYISLATKADPQAGLDRALRSWGNDGFVEVPWYELYREDANARRTAILSAAKDLRPTLVFMQILPGAIDVNTIKTLRQLADKNCVIVSWSGDVASYDSPWRMDEQVAFGRSIDLMAHASFSHVEILRAAGCHNAVFLQIGVDGFQYSLKK